MKLPKSITPCPIKEAIAEVRFESNVPADAVFGIVYQALKKDFPHSEPLPIVALPTSIRDAAKDLIFQPHYRLLSEDYVVLTGPRVIAVGMRGEYPGWPGLAARIKDTLRQFNQTGILSQTVRLGLRFISFFPFDIYPKLRLRITVNEQSWDGEETQFKTVLSRGGCKSLLQIGKGLALVDRPGETGSIIDIDSFTTETAGDFSNVLGRFLDSAHQSEKELFFTLLEPEFLTSLKPIYDDAN